MELQQLKLKEQLELTDWRSTKVKKYIVEEGDFTKKYIDKYLSACQEKKEKECFKGKNSDYRFILRNSMVLNMTDIEVLIEYVFYPMYVNGNTTIDKEVTEVLFDLLHEKDVLGIYQVVEYLYYQNYLKEKFTDLPFIIDPLQFKKGLYQAVEVGKYTMENYKEGDFSMMRNNMYQIVMTELEKIYPLEDNKCKGNHHGR